jgi:hypothetical protein
VFAQPLTEITTTNRNLKKKILGSIARPVLEADYLTTICEPTVYTMWDPVTGIALLYFSKLLYPVSKPRPPFKTDSDIMKIYTFIKK